MSESQKEFCTYSPVWSLWALFSETGVCLPPQLCFNLYTFIEVIFHPALDLTAVLIFLFVHVLWIEEESSL